MKELPFFFVFLALTSEVLFSHLQCEAPIGVCALRAMYVGLDTVGGWRLSVAADLQCVLVAGGRWSGTDPLGDDAHAGSPSAGSLRSSAP